MQQQQNDSRIGLQLGNYRLTKILGRGGFARVYSGKHIFLQTEAAIKVLDVVDMTDVDRDEFTLEARTISQLHHPNIVRVLEFGIQVDQQSDKSTPYLVMEFASNGTLRQRHPRNSQVPFPLIATYAHQIANALQFAHDQKIVHRDVKPENMLVQQDDHVLLSDFGIAITGHDSKNQPVVINNAAVQGTAGYIAPERLMENKTSRASDQYSLGIVAYEWLVGSRPFEGTQEQIIDGHVRRQPPSMRAKNPAITPQIEAVIMKALAKRPEDRFSSIMDFAQTLEMALRAADSQQQVPPWQQAASPSQPQPASPKQEPIKLDAGSSTSFSGNSGYTFNPKPQVVIEHNVDRELFPELKDLWRIPIRFIGRWIELDSEFARIQKNKGFRDIGTFLNIASAIIAGILVYSGGFIVFGLLVTLIGFYFCIRVVNPIIAIIFGLAVACWWGAVGVVVAYRIAGVFPAFGAFLPPMLVGVIFLALSGYLHIRYVNNRLP